jgi:hypothetical protein
MSVGVAKAAQMVVSAIVVALIWRCFRHIKGRKVSGQLASAALLVGTFLASPHTFVYDLPMLTAALALFLEARRATCGSLSLGEVFILLLAFVFPALMMATGVNLPVSTMPLTLLFGLILWRQRHLMRE